MEKANLFSGIFWLLFSALIAFLSWRMGLGGMYQPGPGFLYFWTSVVLAFLALITIIKSWRQGGTRQSLQFMFAGVNYRKIITVLASLFVFSILLEWVGFIPMTFLLFLFLLWAVEKRSARLSLLTSAIVTGSSYLIFQIWLKTQLPLGLLDFLR